MSFRRRNIILGLCFLLSLKSTAEASGATVYSFENVPDIASIVLKDGKMFAAFGGATVTDAMNTFNKLLPLDLKGKTKCTKLEHVELGTGWTENPCLTVRHASDGEYVIDVVNRFDYGDTSDAGYVDFLKTEDFVKERRFTFRFSVKRNGCEIEVTKRSYIPINGKKSKPSRTGSGICTVKKH
jgi:hypothetical protein